MHLDKNESTIARAHVCERERECVCLLILIRQKSSQKWMVGLYIVLYPSGFY